MNGPLPPPRDPYTPADPAAPKERGTAAWWLVLLGLLIALVIWDMQRTPREADAPPATPRTEGTPP